MGEKDNYYKETLLYGNSHCNEKTENGGNLPSI